MSSHHTDSAANAVKVSLHLDTIEALKRPSGVLRGRPQAVIKRYIHDPSGGGWELGSDSSAGIFVALYAESTHLMARRYS